MALPLKIPNFPFPTVPAKCGVSFRPLAACTGVLADKAKAGEFSRANGDVACAVCQRPYRDHPVLDGQGDSQGLYHFLHVDCEGNLLHL